VTFTITEQLFIMSSFIWVPQFTFVVQKKQNKNYAKGTIFVAEVVFSTHRMVSSF